MKNNNVTRTYSVDLGSKILSLSIALIFLAGLIFAFNEFSFSKRIGIFIGFLSLLYFFLLFLMYKITITESSIIIENSMLPLPPVISQEIAFNEISRVCAWMTFFDDYFIVIYYGITKKKNVFFPVGLGFPWEILNDIVQRLPASTQIDFDPDLWKKLKNLKPVSAKKLILVAFFLIVLVSLVAWYFWHQAFK